MAVFTKPAIPPSEQLNCLKDRGLIIQDEAQALAKDKDKKKWRKVLSFIHLPFMVGYAM